MKSFLWCLLACVPSLAAAQPTELPWTKNPGQLSVKRAASLRELLVHIEPSHWNSFLDGQPLSVNEDETLYRLLYRLPGVSGYDWQRLSQPLGDARWLMDAPADQRGLGVNFAGRIQKVERIEVLPEVARRLEFDHYFRATIRCEGVPQPVLVCTRNVPAPFVQLDPLDEPVSCRAVFLKTSGAASDAEAPLVFAANRLDWHPDQPHPDLQVTADHVLLAKHGFDVDRLRDIAKLDTLPLTSLDTECFFQMLAAVDRCDPAELKARAVPFDLAPVLQKPADHHGQLYHLMGRARRVTKVVLNEPELKDRFGIDHYYQIDVMVPLGDRAVRIARDKQDPSGPLIDSTFPVVCCVLELPERLRNVTDREDLNEDMVLDAFHLRLWSYQSQFLDKFDREQKAEAIAKALAEGRAPPTDEEETPKGKRRQPSPLFLAKTAAFAPPVEKSDYGLGAVVTWVLLGAIAVVGLLVWRHQRGDVSARERLRRPPTALDLTPPRDETP
ncbi:MAG: hypothetical protein U0939_16350 [Pirellulales bacterium]